MADSHPLPPRLLAIAQDLPLEQLAFVAVPVRARHDGWTRARQQGFIVRLALGGCVSLAARGVGMTPKSAYRLRDRPGAESFAASWDKALGWGRDRQVDVSLERSLCGERVPVMRDGRCVGVRHRFDNRLAMTVLNAMDRRAERSPLSLDPVAAFERVLAALGGEKPTPAENKGISRANPRSFVSFRPAPAAPPAREDSAIPCPTRPGQPAPDPIRGDLSPRGAGRSDEDSRARYE